MQVFLITLLWTLLACYVELQLHGEEKAPTYQLQNFTAQPVSNAQTARRLALVIGNGAYTAMPDSLQPLANPTNDAEDIANQLLKLGFDVTLLKNGTLEAMDDTIHSFSSKINKGDVALLYYSGHGIQVGGENFLLPVDAKFKREDQVERQAIKASLLLDKLDSASTKLVFLDACRNNPFLARSMRAFGRTGPPGSGLAAPSTPYGGTLLVYSTAPGNVAEDGSGRNSPFTQGLLKFIASPGIDAQLMLRKVRAEVQEKTNDRQMPWDSSSLKSDFYFVPGQENQQLQADEKLEHQKQDFYATYNAADKSYCNNRYGFCVNYPNNFGSEPTPDNNDGQVFFDRDGFRLTVSGINNITDETINSDMNGFLNEFDAVTYRKLGKNWFALSGYKDESIIYIKGLVGTGSINHLYLQYPSTLKADYDDIVKQIVLSFRPGNLNDSH